MEGHLYDFIPKGRGLRMICRCNIAVSTASDNGDYRSRLHREQRLPSEVSLARQREGYNVIAEPGANATEAAGSNDNELTAIDLVGHRRRLTTRWQPALAERSTPLRTARQLAPGIR